MGPQQPSTHGDLRLALVTEGDIVTKVTPHHGYMHRCFEKHAEAVDYPGIIPYTDRVDYLAAMSQNLTYALTVEKLVGLTVPERVDYIRVIMCEFNRIASHLVSIGTYGLDIGAFTPFLWCFRDREMILDLLEWVSGARMLYNYIWIGGVARDLPEGWLEKAKEFLEYFEPKVDEINNLPNGRFLITALGPSDYCLTKYEENLDRCFSPNDPETPLADHIPRVNHNLISNGLLIEYGDSRIILAACRTYVCVLKSTL
jgi:NADH-quinone oxidoreductase subunit D